MHHIPSYYVVEYIRNGQIDFRMLDEAEATRIRSSIINKYTNGTSRWIWEMLVASVSVQDPEAWSLLDNFILGRPFLLFFNEYEDNRMIEFPANTKVVPILEECPGFEFYVTDVPTSYLICFNHHDFLIGAGTAVEWIRRHFQAEAT